MRMARAYTRIGPTYATMIERQLDWKMTPRCALQR
jgi:hypothetical protein